MNRQRRSVRPVLCLLTAGLCLVGGTATADTITMSASALTNRDFKFIYAGNTYDDQNTGAVTWQRVSGSTAFDNSFQTFCIDVTQTFNFNPSNPPSYTYTLTPLQNAPWDNAQHNTGMGLAKAKLLSELWDNFHSQVTNDDNSAAFQIAVWEIVFETSGNALDLTSGNFKANYGTSQVQGYVKLGSEYVPTYVKTAQNWLNTLTGNGPLDPNLVALTSDTAQDQFTFTSVPAPPGVLLAGIGGLGLVLGRWRRRAI